MLRMVNNVGTTLGLVPVDHEVAGAAAEDEAAPLADFLACVATQKTVAENDRLDFLGRRRRFGP
jgi:hypothetical protein